MPDPQTGPRTLSPCHDFRPFAKGWRAGGSGASCPYRAGSFEAAMWRDGKAARQAHAPNRRSQP